MRIPIGYKFIIGFIVVIAAVIFSPKLVGTLGYSAEMSGLLAYAVAMTFGLILGWLFSKGFTANISKLAESADAISRGDLTGEIVPRSTQDTLSRSFERLRTTILSVTEQGNELASAGREGRLQARGQIWCRFRVHQTLRGEAGRGMAARL